jgi:hypothetical protein
MVLMKITHPKTNMEKTFRAKLCFEFMTDSVAIEPGFRQQVVAEALKIFRKDQNASFRIRRWRARAASGQF